MSLPSPRIETIGAKYFVGIRLPMSFAANRTAELWQTFMPLRGRIENRVSAELYSLQVYPPALTMETSFEKWALAEVAEGAPAPEGMESFRLEGGQYAVFQYKGHPAAAQPFFEEIFQVWLPASGYVLDDRPHFEILGAAYRNNHPDSEEEVWIPVKKN